MVIRLTGLPYPLDALGAGLSLRPDCALAPFGERSAFHDFDRHFERMNERVEIGWFAQIARIDVQGRRRIGGGKLELAARGRADDAGRGRVGVGRDFQRRQRRRIAHEQRLMIGDEKARITFGEQVRLENVVVRRRDFPAGFMDDESQ